LRRNTEDEFDTFENLAGRYARMLDVILNKVFRSIDAIELEDGGTLLGVVNRAEKTGIVSSAERIRDLKDLDLNPVGQRRKPSRKPSPQFLSPKLSFFRRAGWPWSRRP